MGRLIDGEWVKDDFKKDAKGRFVREATVFRGRLGSETHPAQPGRYHLYVSLACPWAHRVLIVRKLRKLEDVISLSVVDLFMSDEGWHFSEEPGATLDSVNGKQYLREVYTASDAHYTGRVTVPVLWDKQAACIVNNESREIIRMLNTSMLGLGDPSVNFCPPPLKDKIDETLDAIYEPVNNGVYRSGFAKSQDAYNKAVTELFGALGHWDGILGQQRYLCGGVITEADWCLFTTLVRFDTAYYGHFKCNIHHIWDYPNLWNYLKDLYQNPGVAETCNFEHIKGHYYRSHETVNPTRVVPAGPTFDLTTPHDRDRIG